MLLNLINFILWKIPWIFLVSPFAAISTCLDTSKIISTCNRLFYTIHIMHSHGLNDISAKDIFNAIIVSRVLYACPSWIGLCTKQQVCQLNKIMHHAKCLGYCVDNRCDIEVLAKERDQTLFLKVLNNSNHILHSLLPPVKDNMHFTRSVGHNRTLPELIPPHDCRNFVFRMLYEYTKITTGHIYVYICILLSWFQSF